MTHIAIQKALNGSLWTEKVTDEKYLKGAGNESNCHAQRRRCSDRERP
jgi:hypothetical protein